MFHHAVGTKTFARRALAVITQVHPRCVHPGEPRRIRGVVAFDEVDGLIDKFLIFRLHPLLGQRAGVDPFLHANGPKQRINFGAFGIGGLTVQNTARTKLSIETRVLRIEVLFWFFFGVQVIQISVKLFEAWTVGRISFRSPRWFLLN
jgi:hypothetical protein